MKGYRLSILICLYDTSYFLRNDSDFSHFEKKYTTFPVPMVQ